MGISIINHPSKSPKIVGINYSQSWVVSGIVIPTWTGILSSQISLRRNLYQQAVMCFFQSNTSLKKSSLRSAKAAMGSHEKAKAAGQFFSALRAVWSRLRRGKLCKRNMQLQHTKLVSTNPCLSQQQDWFVIDCPKSFATSKPKHAVAFDERQRSCRTLYTQNDFGDHFSDHQPVTVSINVCVCVVF